MNRCEFLYQQTKKKKKIHHHSIISVDLRKAFDKNLSFLKNKTKQTQQTRNREGFSLKNV